VYYVVYSYQEEQVGLAAAELALRLVRALLPPELPSALPAEERAVFDFAAELENLARLADQVALGPSTAALVAAATRRGIPFIRLNEASLVQFGYGKYQRRIQATVTSLTSQIAVDIAQDKALTAQLLGDVGLPVPRQRLVTSAGEAEAAAEALGYPVVVKPLDASHGRGVSLELQSAAEVRVAFEKAREHRDEVLVEQFVTGSDHRILVVHGDVIAVAERVPGHVTGDGVHTIRELVEIVNSDPRRGVGHEKTLTRIALDQQALRLIGQAGLTPDSVLPEGQRLFLRSTGNLSTGGTAIDRTDAIAYENAELARRAARVIGLDVAGIDFITPDISRPASEVGGAIVEVNAAPGFRMHVAPTEGRARDVAAPVIDMLFPPGAPSRIPLAAITGTNGKTTTTRMVGHILKMSGLHVGMTTTDGIYVDGERLLRGDMSGPWSARMVLRDPTVDAAVLETARGGILREGLGFDRCDVGAVLNVSADHLGLRGVETLEDLAHVKQLVVEVVRDEGTAVLNADDPLTVAMARETPGRVMYFGLDPRGAVIREHVRAGGAAVVLEEGVNGQMITYYSERSQRVNLLWTHLIPATLEGRATFNVANACAAAAIALALGVSVENVRQGLRTFQASFFQTPGRLNVFDEHPFRVIVDYAHNPRALEAIGELVGRLRRAEAIGVLSVPGDRRDQDIRAVAAIAARAFDRLILKEDIGLRGRAPGEIAELLRAGALEAGLPGERVLVCLPETEAVARALALAQKDDLVVIFADEITQVWKQVTKWKSADL
jgi:cyanophycin synthetase